MIPYEQSVASFGDQRESRDQRDISRLVGIGFLWAVTIAAVIGCSDITGWLG
ncbi:hypothetical protein WBP07_11155 [Novosphingobium sp. BL-8A]|uniref:hypothetical protein n=1 Tax=Novosphingobium sp. BL-8A TaxID=3127639 RepID=UPI00375653A8